MNFPKEIVINILSFVDNESIKKLKIPSSYYKEYLINRLKKTRSDIWYQGVYNNLYYCCFNCKSDLDEFLHVAVVCINCELLLDNYCNYPTICNNCLKKFNFKRGKICCLECPSCKDNRMHIGITSFS